MNLNPAALQMLAPRAIAWVKEQERQAMSAGKPLTDVGIELARDVGVSQPERIRVCVVPALPMPEDADLREVAMQMGLLSMAGLTLGHAVFVRNGHQSSKKLLRHEFRHVYQYEAAGSTDAFVLLYLTQIAQRGYNNAPYEVDARAHEGTGLLDFSVEAIAI